MPITKEPPVWMPEAMTRLIWVVPQERLAPSLETLAATGTFHPADRLALGEHERLLALEHALRDQRRQQRLLEAQRTLAQLPACPLLHYEVAIRSDTGPLPEGALPLEEGLYLQVGTSHPPPQPPPVQPVVPPPLLSDRQQRLLFATRDQVGRVGTWAIIDGWIPSRRAGSFQQLLDGEAIVLVPAEQTGLPLSRVPSLFRRPRWQQGFAALMGLYGVTGYREFDPTALLALSFTLMFGMMFADLGQGLLLFLLGLTLHRGFPANPNLQSTGLLLMPIGLSAALFGMLFGNLFAREDWIPPLIHYPLDQVFISLAISVLIGMGILCLGMLIGLFNAWQGGRLRQYLWDNYGPIGLLFYLALVGAVLSYLLGWSVICYLMGALALVSLLAKSQACFRNLCDEPLGLRLFQSLIETYDFVGKFVVQTLSFVRLAAFTFAHIGLSMALIVIVEMLAGHPWLAWTVFVIGNLLITAVEGVLVFIQVVRLHFFELFTKFTAAGGLAFAPLRIAGET